MCGHVLAQESSVAHCCPQDTENPLLLLLVPLRLSSPGFVFHLLPVLQDSLHFQLLYRFVQDTLPKGSQNTKYWQSHGVEPDPVSGLELLSA